MRSWLLLPLSPGRLGAWLVLVLGALAPELDAQPFLLPTANHALFEPGGEARFFVGTVGKPWLSGAFGCVRSEGWQFHEGLDIACLERNRRGEPVDPVGATADGVVVYCSTRPALSNYGTYLIVRHQIQGIEVYSLYAHLASIREGIRPGQPVRAGEILGTMGRSTNTHQGISKDRAHVHFELNLRLSDRYEAWHQVFLKGQRNDHGSWNGRNLAGLDPWFILSEQRRLGTNFNLVRHIQSRPELCRVMVRATQFSWLQRYPAFVRPGPRAATEGVAGYEVSIDYAGVPFLLVSRSASEITGPARLQLLSVNEPEYEKHPCRRLVVRKGDGFQLGRNGEQLLELLTF